MQVQNQNNMARVAKTQGKKKKKTIISKENKNKILRAYISLYNAFLLKNLMSGKTLGAASYSALQLLKAKIATMDKRNPVTKLLLRIHKYHTKVVTKRVMTSKYRDLPMVVRPEERGKLAAFISKKFNEATATLNSMTKQYQPKQKAVLRPKFVNAQQKVAAKPAQQKQNVMLLIQVKQMNDMRQRAA